MVYVRTVWIERTWVYVITLSQFMMKLPRKPAIAINLDSANKHSDTHKHFIIELISNYMIWQHDSEARIWEKARETNTDFIYIKLNCDDMLSMRDAPQCKNSKILNEHKEERLFQFLMHFTSLLPGKSQLNMCCILWNGEWKNIHPCDDSYFIDVHSFGLVLNIFTHRATKMKKK